MIAGITVSIIVVIAIAIPLIMFYLIPKLMPGTAISRKLNQMKLKISNSYNNIQPMPTMRVLD